MVDKHFISQNYYKLLKASSNSERILALTTGIHADFNMWTFKGYVQDGNRSQVDVAQHRM